LIKRHDKISIQLINSDSGPRRVAETNGVSDTGC
jgi:hypothetical protein